LGVGRRRASGFMWWQVSALDLRSPTSHESAFEPLAEETNLSTNVAAYIRVSSKAQDHQMQRVAIERAAAARGDVVGSWFSEKLSAKTIVRPELDRLRAHARLGCMRRLYVFRLDRICRSGIRDLFEVVEELRRCGVEVVSLTDGFSLDGPAADVIVAVLAWAAKMERLSINERISAARVRVESEGRAWGRPALMTPQLRIQAVGLRAAGKSMREISQHLGLSKSVIARALASSPKHGAMASIVAASNSPTSQD
jgi:DNA invertase Pin-like site-specific DNA recombinase